MSTRELERVEVMGRVAKGGLKLRDAAVMLQLSYRQVKRVWRRYQEAGGKGLKHGNVGQVSNHGKPLKLRRRVLHLIKKQYSGSEETRFGPTLAAEHLGRRRWDCRGSRDLAALDVGGAAMESATPREETLPAAGTEGTLRRAGTAGWEFSRLARKAWSTGLPDEHGGRCHQPDPGSYGQRGDDLGGCRRVTEVD